jgi:hypothetical protein
MLFIITAARSTRLNEAGTACIREPIQQGTSRASVRDPHARPVPSTVASEMGNVNVMKAEVENFARRHDLDEIREPKKLRKIEVDRRRGEEFYFVQLPISGTIFLAAEGRTHGLQSRIIKSS